MPSWRDSALFLRDVSSLMTNPSKCELNLNLTPSFVFKVVALGVAFSLEAVHGGGDGSSFVPEGYVLRWQDDFEGSEINTTNWVVARVEIQ